MVSEHRKDEWGAPSPARIFCSLIFARGFRLDRVLERLVSAWGDPEFFSRLLPFDYTRYYEEEMGGSLSRKFLSFQRLVPQDALPGLKQTARQVESCFLNDLGGRKVNIDPGLFLPDKLVLATTKPCAHRPYLSQGVFADLTLTYQRKSYQPLPWTYPDYASGETIAMMNALRGRHRVQAQLDRDGGFS